MPNAIQITEDEFNATYTLRPNHFDPHASWGPSAGPGCLFETYGDELKFILAQDPRTIWTLMDGDDGRSILVSGYHLVNRIGYLVSTTPVPDDTFITVVMPNED